MITNEQYEMYKKEEKEYIRLKTISFRDKWKLVLNIFGIVLFLGSIALYWWIPGLAIISAIGGGGQGGGFLASFIFAVFLVIIFGIASSVIQNDLTFEIANYFSDIHELKLKRKQLEKKRKHRLQLMELYEMGVSDPDFFEGMKEIDKK